MQSYPSLKFFCLIVDRIFELAPTWPKTEKTMNRKQLRSSEKKKTQKKHTLISSSCWSTLIVGGANSGPPWAGDIFVRLMVSMPSVRIASHTSGCVDGWGRAEVNFLYRPSNLSPERKHLNYNMENRVDVFTFLTWRFIFVFVTLRTCSGPFPSFGLNRREREQRRNLG